MRKKELYEHVLAYFERTMDATETELHFSNPFELLVAVVLSAQCTDKRINQVTPALFSRYPTAQAMAQAEVDDVLQLISSVSYPNAKANHLVAMSRQLVSDFHGDVPSDRSQLMTLPGVGRKTANVIQAVWFGKPTMAVDTHVYRVSHRLGLVPQTANTPLKVEQQLMRYIPVQDIPDAHHWLLLHGRYICRSNRPLCGECPFDSFCPKRFDDSKL